MGVLDSYIRLLVEDQSSYTGLTFFRPDTSGIRGKGVNRKAYQAGDDEFPYGEAEPNWGEPWAYSRDSAGHGPSHASVPVPKGVGDEDDRWDDDIDEMGAEGWTSGTPPQGNMVDPMPRSLSKFGVPDEEDEPWDDGTTEAVGVPFNSAKAGQGTGGMHTGGRVSPGSSGQWSSRPKGGKWDNAVTDDELEKAGRGDGPLRREYNYGMPFAGSVADRAQKTNSDDEKIPNSDAPDSEKGSTVLKFGNTGFGSTPGAAFNYHRMKPGFTWKESMHRGLVEAFVSLKDTPSASMQRSHPMGDVDLDLAKNRFGAVAGHARKKFDKMQEPDLVRFFLQIEPDHFMRSLGEIGKDRLVGIYDEWESDVLGGDSSDIERMAERIMKAVGIAGE